MNGRIIKQYEDAIKAHKAGKSFDFDELPTPPGFGPIPTGCSVPSVPAQNPVPSTAPSPSTSGPSPPKRSAPAVPANGIFIIT